MHRRSFLAATTAVAAGLSGCTGGGEGSTPTPGPTSTATPEPTEAPSRGDVDLPDGVYEEPFESEMSMQGQADAGPYRVAVAYAAPHRFWLVEGDRTRERPVRPADDLHLMALVWDAETGVVVPETGLSVEIRREGDLVSEEVIYPMLSQRMGFHYGGNFILDAEDDADGAYDVEVRVGAPPIRTTGDFDGRFDEPASASVEISFTAAERRAVEPEENDDYGRPGAVPTMEMEMLPEPLGASTVPGERLGVERTDDAEVVPTVLEGDDAPIGDRYLAVYLRTRYNGLVLPSAALRATVRDGDETAYDLRRTFDPDAGYHYGAALSAPPSEDAEVVVEPVTPPQTARHEGYERAFLDLDAVSFSFR